MALLCLKLPQDTARLLSEIKVPGRKVPMDEKHVTLLYLGKDLDIEAVLLAIQTTYQVVASWAPFLMTTRWVTTFDKQPEKTEYPVIARVESEDLHELQAALKDAFEEEGVPHSDKWPDYKPHVTLSYSKSQPEDFTIPPVQWACTEITLWGGDEGDNSLSCRFPLSIMGKAASSTADLKFRPYVQAAMFMERYSSSKPKSRM